MDLDRQAIERRDFPISRRGYDPAAVDAHLRSLAAEIEELQRAAGSGPAAAPLAASASSQVQGIIAAAEAAAADIEREAREAAQAARDAADSDAEETRRDAIEKARAHVAAVAQVAATLLERVGGMDTEVRALIDTLRAGSGRLATDLAAVDANMGELYDAASGGKGRRVTADAAATQRAAAPVPPPARPPQAPPPITAERTAAPKPAQEPPPRPAAEDLDGARLIALNMALNGDSRDDTERYLAEHFELSDRGALVDEVYAAIEG